MPSGISQDQVRWGIYPHGLTNNLGFGRRTRKLKLARKTTPVPTYGLCPSNEAAKLSPFLPEVFVERDQSHFEVFIDNYSSIKLDFIQRIVKVKKFI